MKDLRYTLVSDGSSDRALLPVLTWLLRDMQVTRAIQATWADLRRLRKPPRSLHERILTGLELYPCDLLFVHRDAEQEPLDARIREIQDALARAGAGRVIPPAVCVVPVRMHEAWLLFDEAAIRRAAGNPNGREYLALPRLAGCETLPDPKGILHGTLRSASGYAGRRLHSFDPHSAALRLAELIEDFAPLRALPAFQRLEADLRHALQSV